MSRTLSSNANLDNLRREAKRWLKAIAEGDAAAAARFLGFFPGHAAAPKLREVQQALARDYGFASWAALKQELEDRARSAADRIALFLEKSVHRYGTNPATQKWGDYERDGPARGALAARLLARHPEIARDSIHTAVAAHDLAAVQAWLAKAPGLAHDRHPFDGWTPLLRLAYARLPIAAVENALAIAAALLDAGADPNAFWSDATNAFNVLVGIIGGGEAAQSAHPHAEAFARLLIERGADPFVPQALYNISIGEDSTVWLDLLWRESDKRRETAKWTGPAPDALGGERSASAVAYLLGNAVPARPAWIRWLLARGADARGVNFYSRLPVIKHAMLAGQTEIVELLVQHGAARPELTESERFLAAVAAGDLPSLHRMATANPALLANPDTMFTAIAMKRADLVEVLLDLGASPDIGDAKGFRALHYTTHCGALEAARLLIARGAEIDPFEERYGGTPLTHAVYQGRPEMVALLVQYSANFRGLCRAGATDRLRALLIEAPDRANREDRPGEPALFCLPSDEDKAVEVAELLLSFGADPNFRNPLGQTPAEAARRLGLEDAAGLLEDAER